MSITGSGYRSDTILRMVPLSFPDLPVTKCTPFADHLTKINESFEKENLTTLDRILDLKASSLFAEGTKERLLGPKWA